MNDIFEMLLNKYNTAISNRVDALAKKELIESLPAKASFDKLNEQFLNTILLNAVFKSPVNLQFSNIILVL